MKTNGLTGPALEWAAAKADGLSVFERDPTTGKLALKQETT